MFNVEKPKTMNDHCEAKPTTLKRPSPGDGFENHMYHTKTRGGMKCNFHINGHLHYLRSWCFTNASLLNK